MEINRETPENRKLYEIKVTIELNRRRGNELEYDTDLRVTVGSDR